MSIEGEIIIGTSTMFDDCFQQVTASAGSCGHIMLSCRADMPLLSHYTSHYEQDSVGNMSKWSHLWSVDNDQQNNMTVCLLDSGTRWETQQHFLCSWVTCAGKSVVWWNFRQQSEEQSSSSSGQLHQSLQHFPSLRLFRSTNLLCHLWTFCMKSWKKLLRLFPKCRI